MLAAPLQRPRSSRQPLKRVASVTGRPQRAELRPEFQRPLGQPEQVEPRPLTRFRMPDGEYAYTDVSAVTKVFSRPGDRVGELHKRTRTECALVSHGLLARLNVMLGLELFIVEADDTPYARETANIVRKVFRRIKKLRRALTRWHDAVYDGTSFVEKTWYPDRRVDDLWVPILEDVALWNVAYLRTPDGPQAAFRRPMPERYFPVDRLKLSQHHGPGDSATSPFGGPGLGEAVFFLVDLWQFLMEKSVTAADVRTLSHIYLQLNDQLLKRYKGEYRDRWKAAAADLMPVLQDMQTDQRGVLPPGATVANHSFNSSGESAALDIYFARIERLTSLQLNGAAGDFQRSKSTAGSAGVSKEIVGDLGIQDGAALAEGPLTELCEEIAAVNVGPDAPAPHALLVHPADLVERATGIELAERLFGDGAVGDPVGDPADDRHSAHDPNDEADSTPASGALKAAFKAQKRGGLGRCWVRF